MFRFHRHLTSDSSIPEFADFFELLALTKQRVSDTEVLRYFIRISENELKEGCDDDSDDMAIKIEETFAEIERRQNACNDGYPFYFDSYGNVLNYSGLSTKDPNIRHLSYVYLLLSTRLNMKDDKKQDNIDGTEILEELATYIIKSYLGVLRAESINFGTSVRGKFSDKVNELCKRINEGVGYYCPETTTRHQQDGKLDTVGWIPFKDELNGKLVIFAQCKTGSTWKESVHQLQPEDFNRKFMQRPFHVTPIRSFFVSESVDRSRWHDISSSTGILFDRCRIVDFCPEILDDLYEKMYKWVDSARQMVNAAINE